MRTIIFVAATLLLAGCETGEGWVPGLDAQAVQQPPPQPPQPSTPAPEEGAAANPVNAHCDAVARQRAADARANGYSFKMETVVYDGTYKDCVAWDSEHAPG